MAQPTAGQKPDSQELTQRLTSIIDYVRDCERRVNQGEILELDGLDRNVVSICDGISALPQEEGKRLEEQMSELIKDLERLAGAMREQQKKIEAEAG
ncbi:MAG: hypothetical protein EPN97_13360 [Alphaproteobacteria bacterium]|nr:MAG: hypothetical protein EPN97_13360 [Alphaproteobacteria bacterium]